MTYRLNTDKSAAVALDYEYQPMSTCPRGVSIVGLSETGVARIDKFSGKSSDLVAWAPLPRRPKWLNELEGRS